MLLEGLILNDSFEKSHNETLILETSFKKFHLESLIMPFIASKPIDPEAI